MRTRAERPPRLLLSCEHAGNRVPARWRALFAGAERVLASHRGWDPGALQVARALSRRLGAPLVFTTITRLLVEPNRSLGHPRHFSEFTETLSPEQREELVARYWRPHREQVEALARKLLARAGSVLHLGVHTFTPVLDGKPRTVDVGVLYDPARARERDFCQAWLRRLRLALPELRVRANAPYKGASDGLTTHLRGVLGESYLGVELELGQALMAGEAKRKRALLAVIADTLAEGLGSAQRSTGAAAASRRGTPAAAATKRTRPTSG